ncbi:hypothetical protein APA_2052 [Pseudanabaena sp. lw0831]|uniref:DEAD/DEAH box helicase family protein n=1 Tax=Pseudanabaena sp. lw0831 TaxID=1357935 RepID=UPI001916C553|nr:DEAD/DEAH box helicase family protein [Pseudanabaena sp. lw0831]GBO54104.1 hypothetical protein APA_2052 [Pseudanabaena sp. lw0831]
MNQIDAKGAVYCSEFMTELPKGIINKIDCGCGITSLAIEDKYPTIIVVPTVEIIHNKLGQYPNERSDHQLYGVYSGVRHTDIDDYLNELHPSLPPKILTTYDSFYKVAEVIVKNESKYRIVVDEFSELLDAYDYRESAIDDLLKCLERFSYVSYVSATPIQREKYPTQLKDLEETEIVWGQSPKIHVSRHCTSKPFDKVKFIIENYRIAGDKGYEMPNGHRSHAAYFFLNSVKEIKRILDKAELPKSQVRVICASKETNKGVLGAYTIGSALDTEKRFNFITRKAFKGADFYSKSGLIFIVSNSHNKNTMLSIDTDVKQIIGRLRDKSNPFRNMAIHIYNEDSSLLSREEFAELVDEKTRETIRLLSIFSKCNPEEANTFLKPYRQESQQDNYLHFDENGLPKFNDYRIVSDWRKWETSHAIYCDGYTVRQTYKDNDISTDSKIPDDLLTTTFRSLCLKYIQGDVDRDYIAAKEPLVKKAYDCLGQDKMKALCFKKEQIRKAVLDVKPQILDAVENEIRSRFKVGSNYSRSEVKKIIASVYTELGVQKNPTATDIDDYFNTKYNKKRVDGKSTGFIEILAD